MKIFARKKSTSKVARKYIPAKSVSKRNNPKKHLRPVHRSNHEKFSFKSFFGSIFDFKFNHDQRLFAVFIVLLLIGIAAVYSSSIVFAYRLTDNKFYFLINHLRSVGLGFIGLTVFYFIRPEIFVKFWFVFLFASIILLVLTLVLNLVGQNESVDGATRWLALGQFQFQPSDFAKLSFIIFIAAFLSRRIEHYDSFKEYFYRNLMPFVSWMGLLLALILLGRNLGTALVIGFIGIICYGASVSTKYHRRGFLWLIIVITLVGVPSALFVGYRGDRVDVWTNYWKTNDTAIVESNGIKTAANRSYQFDQVLTSIGSGGLTGVGMGQSIGKFYFVKTTASDDSIVGIMGEELGFLFLALILILYLYLGYRCITIANEFEDKPIYFYLMIGAASWIVFQMFVHVGANIGVIPLTGQTLPFISFGGSSLISLMCAMGLILNVSKQRS
jgi:cell division protein FtsW